MIRRLAAPAIAALLVLAGCGSADESSTAETTAATAPGTEATTTGADAGDGELYRYVIPAGTGLDLDNGVPVEIVPQLLEINVGDTVEIVNEDDRGHNVGPFFVAEGETVAQTFRSVAEYADVCSVHPSGEFRINVT